MRTGAWILVLSIVAVSGVVIGLDEPVAATTSLTPISPQVALDTATSGTKVGAVDGSAAAYELRIDEVPLSSDFVGLNIALTETEANDFGGFITVYSCAISRPNSAQAIFSTGVPSRTSLLTDFDADGDVCIYVYGRAHLWVEVFGYMAAGSTHTAVGPQRVLDSRASSAVTTQQAVSVTSASVPAGAMVDMKVTVVGPSASGTVTISDCSGNGTTLAAAQGVTESHPVMVAASSSREICVASTASTHLLVDVYGYDTGSTRSIYPSGPTNPSWTYNGSGFVIGWAAPANPTNIGHYRASVAGSTGEFTCDTRSAPAALTCTAPATAAALGSDRWFSTSVWAVSDVGAFGPSTSSGITGIFLEPNNPSAPTRSEALLLETDLFLTDGDLRPGVPTDLPFEAGSFEPGDWVIASLWPDLSNSADTTPPVVLGTGQVGTDGSLTMSITAPASLSAGTTWTLAVVGTTYPTGFRETVTVAAPASAGSSDGWDYVYGSPGPYDYSEFLEVYPTSDGGAYLVGQWSGDFEGMSAGTVYRLFVQYRNAAGAVQWTTSPNVGTTTTAHEVFGGVDGDDVLYLVAQGQSSMALSGSVLSFRSDGTMRTTSVGTVFGSMGTTVPQASQRFIVSPVAGVLVIESSMSTNPSAKRFDADLVQTGSVGIPAELRQQNSGGPAAEPKLVGATAADGSFWIAGWIPRPLPHMQDALGLLKVLVASDGTLSTATTIKHFGYECSSWWDIPRVTTTSVWVYGCGTYPNQSMYAFSPSDGAFLGEVSGLAATTDVMGSEMPTDGAYYSFCDPSFASCLPIGISPYIAAAATDYSPDGSLAFIEVGSGGGWPSISMSAGRVLTTWSISETGAATTWTLLSEQVIASGVEVEAVAPLDEDSVVLAGSTTVDISVRGRVVDGFSTTQRAFIDSRSINPAAGGSNSGSSTAVFTSVTPERILDTRNGVGALAGRVGALDGSATALELQVTGRGGVPAGASAVALNVTVVGGEANDFGGYVTVYPCGASKPEASNLNFVSGQTVPNSVIAPLSSSGTVCLYVYGTAHLLADVSGYFTSGFTPLTPARLLDTRQTGSRVGTLDGTGSAVTLRVAGQGGVPTTGATAVALNVTVVGGQANDFGGYVSVYPCDVAKPDVSNLNFVSGQTVPNSVIAPLLSSGDVCLYVYGTADLLVDVSGYFTSGFSSVTPSRVLDTRSGVGAAPGRVGALDGTATALELQVTGRAGVPGGASAVALNVTVVGGETNDFGGYVTVYPCDVAKPDASNLNFVSGQTVPNSVIAPLSGTGTVCLYVYGTADLLVDVSGHL